MQFCKVLDRWTQDSFISFGFAKVSDSPNPVNLKQNINGAGSIALVVVRHLPNKCKALSSKPVIKKKKDHNINSVGGFCYGQFLLCALPAVIPPGSIACF